MMVVVVVELVLEWSFNASIISIIKSLRLRIRFETIGRDLSIYFKSNYADSIRLICLFLYFVLFNLFVVYLHYYK